MFKSEPDSLYARRIARVVFGAVLCAGACALVDTAATDSRSGRATPIVALSWAAALLLSEIAKRVAAHAPRADGGERLLAWSLALPSIGIALLLPLTLHLPFALAAGGPSAFDAWCTLSIVVVGPAHVVLALLMALRAIRLARGDTAKVMSPRTIYLLTLVTSCVPFALLFAIPPVLVAVTGLPFLGIMRSFARIAASEREEPSVPRAILHAA